MFDAVLFFFGFDFTHFCHHTASYCSSGGGISLSVSSIASRSIALVIVERKFLKDQTENLKGQECTVTCCAWCAIRMYVYNFRTCAVRRYKVKYSHSSVNVKQIDVIYS